MQFTRRFNKMRLLVMQKNEKKNRIYPKPTFFFSQYFTTVFTSNFLLKHFLSYSNAAYKNEKHFPIICSLSSYIKYFCQQNTYCSFHFVFKMQQISAHFPLINLIQWFTFHKNCEFYRRINVRLTIRYEFVQIVWLKASPEKQLN